LKKLLVDDVDDGRDECFDVFCTGNEGVDVAYTAVSRCLERDEMSAYES
jgi:hypothetical protein